MSVRRETSGLDMLLNGIVNLAPPTNPNDAARLADVTAAIALINAIGRLVGDWDASGSSLPTTGSGAAGAINKGDTWQITVAGTITGITPNASLEVGDVIVARVNGATTGSQFYSLQHNDIQASTTLLGNVFIATQTEVNTGTDPNKVVTPATLAGSTLFGRKRVGTITGDGTTTAWPVTHNLNTYDLTPELFDPITGDSLGFYYERKLSGSLNLNSGTFNITPALGNTVATRWVILG